MPALEVVAFTPLRLVHTGRHGDTATRGVVGGAPKLADDRERAAATTRP